MAQLKKTTARRWGLFVLLILELARFGSTVTHELKLFVTHAPAAYRGGEHHQEATISSAMSALVISELIEHEESREEDPETEEAEHHQPVVGVSGRAGSDTTGHLISVKLHTADSGAPFITLG